MEVDDCDVVVVVICESDEEIVFKYDQVYVFGYLDLFVIIIGYWVMFVVVVIDLVFVVVLQLDEVVEVFEVLLSYLMEFVNLYQVEIDYCGCIWYVLEYGWLG